MMSSQRGTCLGVDDFDDDDGRRPGVALRPTRVYNARVYAIQYNSMLRIPVHVQNLRIRSIAIL